ncbi:glycosyl hydrolase family 28 protein [Flavobacterium fluviatile]|uniref:glycosyl hydrolase family 28 protein n=1 Tax=Flavobacterium fluviatile TaxID=1862387 RepID=UPI0013D774A1|nr:glycosyl hydrolase family 28 protein [Flavobacterium fluviatile]
MINNLKKAIIGCSLGLLLGWNSFAQKVKVYPAPSGIELSKAYVVKVEGQTVPVYQTKIPPSEPIPRLKPIGTFGLASVASFDMNASASVSVTIPDKVQSVKILPTSYGIVPTIKGNTIQFQVKNPGHITVEINGQWHESLHILVNPFEKNIPNPKDPNVIYFGPGIHEVTNITVGDGQTIYLAGGAYLRCGTLENEEEVEIRGAKRKPPTFILRGKNVSIRGRGIIDQSMVPKKIRRYTILAQNAQNVTIEGVTIFDPSHWTIPIQSCDKVHVENIKIIGWRGNADGVDITSSREVLVENCFMRTFDDAVVIKSFGGFGEVKNVHTRKCVVWNELAHALSIGAEVHENISKVLFEDCDVIHDVGRETALRVYHCDDAVISDVVFDNIRIEEARRLISCWIGKTRWTETEERGHIKNVTFKNITATSAPIDPTLTRFQDGTDWKPYIIKDHASMELVGYDAEHLVEGIRFENVLLDGKKVQAKNVTMNEFVKDVQFK